MLKETCRSFDALPAVRSLPGKSASSRRRLAVAGVMLAVLAPWINVPVATAASPCAKQVLSDWYADGRVDDSYPLSCYDEALDAVPSDIRDYTDAHDVIARALQEAARQVGVITPPSTPRPPSGTLHPKPQDAPVVSTAASSSIPVPLVVLASSAFVLLGSGALGHVMRRRRDAEIDRSDAGRASPDDG